MNSPVCSHLQHYKSSHGTQSYKIIYKQFIAVINDQARKIKVNQSTEIEIEKFHILLNSNLPISFLG